MTCVLREKNDVQMIFDDLYVFYVNPIDIFK